jgi:hypothetical protein
VPQHDYIIANQSGASLRSDLNNGLAAIVSQNSGATQPSTTYSYQWWADTTTGLLKIRNAANSAWITVGTLASANLGHLLAAGGTLTGILLIDDAANTPAAPALSFDGDTNTGIYSPGADQLAIATGGTGRVFVDTAAVTASLPVNHPLGAAATPGVSFTGDTNTGIYSPGADQLAIATGGVGRVQVAANGSVSSVVPGGTTLYPQFGCRAWVNFDGVGSTIRGSGNVSSVTKTATGEYTINFTTAMPDANYATTGLGHMIVGETTTGRFLAQYGDPLTSSTKVVACNGINANRYDPPFCNVAIFR